MGKIVSKGGQSKELTQEEINDALLEHADTIDYDALYDVMPSPQPTSEDDYYDYWCDNVPPRSTLTWHFEEPVDPVRGDATMDMMDQFVNIYTGERWVRISFTELLCL